MIGKQKCNKAMHKLSTKHQQKYKPEIILQKYKIDTIPHIKYKTQTDHNKEQNIDLH